MRKNEKLSKRILNSRVMHFLLSLLASLLMRAIYATNRVNKEYPAEALPYLTGEKPAVFCFWHGRMIMHPFVKPPGRSMQVLISQHNDGALITATMAWFDIGSVRGSSSRKRGGGGTRAVFEMMDVTGRGGNLSITPDGPRGPFQVAAQGAAYVAAKTGYPILPITFSASRHWRLRSWDKFMIPKPFGRIQFVAHTPILATGEDDAAIAATTAELQTHLAAITHEADEICGVAA